jgi:predicted secreted protein
MKTPQMAMVLFVPGQQAKSVKYKKNTIDITDFKLLSPKSN